MEEDFLRRSWPLSGGVVGKLTALDEPGVNFSGKISFKPLDFSFLYICISIEPSCLFGLSPFSFLYVFAKNFDYCRKEHIMK